MSDDEDQVVGSDEEETEDEDSVEESDEESDEEQMAAPADSGPSEAQLAMQKRRQQQSSLGANLDEVAQEVLEVSRIEREKLEDEIEEMRARNEKRKQEREIEDRKQAEKRNQEEKQRKAVEEERKQVKEAEEEKRREMRAARLAAYEAHSLPQGRNFVITKKEGGEDEEEEDEEDLEKKEKKSKEQQEQEKKAILQQRIKPVKMEDLNSSAKLAEKAKELHSQIVRLESEKYDLEKRFKSQQYDMMELAERARQMNKVGKGGLKRVALKEDEVDKYQERYAGAPAKVEMYSRYERQKDKRTYGTKHDLFHGPTWLFAAEKITPYRIVKFDEETGLPNYEEIEGVPHHDE